MQLAKARVVEGKGRRRGLVLIPTPVLVSESVEAIRRVAGTRPPLADDTLNPVTMNFCIAVELRSPMNQPFISEHHPPDASPLGGAQLSALTLTPHAPT